MRRTGTWAGGRVGSAAVALAAAGLIAGCATTVDGTAVAGGTAAVIEESAPPTGVEPSGNQGTEQTAPPLPTGTTDTAGPDGPIEPSAAPSEQPTQTDSAGVPGEPSTPGSTPAEQTDESLPPVPTAVTITSESPTESATASSDTAGASAVETPGVPPADPDLLRKDIGEDAGITSGEDQDLVFSFKALEIDPAFGPRCNGTDASANGNLIGVKIEFAVLEAYDPQRDIAMGFDPKLFAARGPDGQTYDELGTSEARACKTDSLLPPELAAGDSGTGWIVLDSPIRYGTVTFTQTDLPGGWEWVIPGS